MAVKRFMLTGHVDVITANVSVVANVYILIFSHI